MIQAIPVVYADGESGPYVKAVVISTGEIEVSHKLTAEEVAELIEQLEKR